MTGPWGLGTLSPMRPPLRRPKPRPLGEEPDFDADGFDPFPPAPAR